MYSGNCSWDLNLLSFRYNEFKMYNRTQVDQYRKKHFGNILQFACENSPFYQSYYRHINTEQIVTPSDLPLLNKHILMENWENVVTEKTIKKNDLKKYFSTSFDFEKRFLNEYLAFHTSGSTGYPTYVVWDQGEFQFSIANYFLAVSSKMLGMNSFEDVLARKYQIAYIGIMDDYVGGNSWAYGLKQYANIVMFSVFSPIDYLCEKLDKFNPDIIMTKPSLLGELSRKQSIGELHLNLKNIIFAGEMISPIDGRDIYNYFGIRAKNSYSTCETGPIAFQTSSNDESMDILENMVWLELVDDEGNIIEDYYKLGNIVITNLYNKTMPIIRYNLGDKAYYMPNEKNDALNRISYIYGRETSFFPFSDSNGRRINVSEYPFWNLFVTGILRYQIIQTDKWKIKIRIQFELKLSTSEKDTAKNAMLERVKNILSSYGIISDLVMFTFEEVDKIEPNSAGKIQITFPYKS